MAESRVRRNQAGNFDFDPDTPVPAAEVLIDLKESARRRRSQKKVRTSPRKKARAFEDSPRKTHNHRTSSRRLDFNTSSGVSNHSISESSDEEHEEEDVELLTMTVETTTPSRKSRRLMLHTPSQLPFSSPRQRPDQATLLSASSRLRNLLKLHKAHSWCYHEWFYSDIDQPLLDGENDFCRCLADMFPTLKSRQLTKMQWRQLRRQMGKPRRCSPTFFAEERTLLDYKRSKVRQIQQQVHQGVITVSDFSSYKDIPDKIPTLLVVGTEVTAWLSDKGYFKGRIEAVDIENHSYWVTFIRPGLGKHAVPDTDIRSTTLPEMISIAQLEETQRAQWRPQQLRARTPPRPILPDNPVMHALFSPDSRMDPFLTSSPARRRMLIDSPSIPGIQPQSATPNHVGGFPVDFLRQVTQLSKLLSAKQQRVLKLTEMNTESEKSHARQRAVSVDFQQQYATIIIDLDDINKQLNLRLESIRSHCESLGCGSEIGPPTMNAWEHAQKITDSANSSLEASGSDVKDSKLVGLIARLTGLLLQIEALSESGNSMEVGSLARSVEDIEARIHPQNRKCFQDNVETPVTLIQSGMSPVGTLHAFSVGGVPLPRTPYRGRPVS